MKFLVTMNMSSNQGKPVHQMTCEVEGVNTLQDFHRILHNQDYILVREYYFDYEAKAPTYGKPSYGGKYSLRGRTIINCALIGKVRELEERQ